MIIYVDIDETICDYDGERDYSLASPIPARIDEINKLFDEGHQVVYWTARGTVTGIDWKEITEAQLKKWGVKYSELRMGKPNYDLFICDKAFNSENYFKGQ